MIRYAPDTLDLDNWQKNAACRGLGDTMFPDNSDGKIAEAKRICSGCPVLRACFEAVMRAEGGQCAKDRHGIYAGLTAGQRYNLYRQEPHRWAKRQYGKAAA